jgi:hypothetical protein
MGECEALERKGMLGSIQLRRRREKQLHGSRRLRQTGGNAPVAGIRGVRPNIAARTITSLLDGALIRDP